MKYLSLLALAAAVSAVPHKREECPSPALPTTVVAGVEVLDTPLVRDAIAIISKFTPYLYYHSMRTYLYGAAAISANATLRSQLDLEAHAVGTLLHDLGWDMTPNSPYVSKDKRFEVDGGLGAVKFIKEHPSTVAEEWDEVRLGNVFDGISLHGTVGIGPYKNVQVQHILNSIGFDYPGNRNPAIPEDQYNSIRADFPDDMILFGTNETFTWLAATKPDAHYNTLIQDFGDAYVPGFNSVGHRTFDLVTANLSPPNTTQARSLGSPHPNLYI